LDEVARNAISLTDALHDSIKNRLLVAGNFQRNNDTLAARRRGGKTVILGLA